MYKEEIIIINGIEYEIGFNGDKPLISEYGDIFLNKFTIDEINDHLKTLNELFIARSDRGLPNPELINLNINIGISFIKCKFNFKSHCVLVLNDKLPIDHNGSNMWFLRDNNIKDKNNINIVVPILGAGDFNIDDKLGTIYTFRGV